jgi:hypothetical protein
MSNLFDQKLAFRIKEVFENHEEAFNPDDWEKMQAKMNNTTNKRYFLFVPFIAKAASIIVFLGLSVFMLNDESFHDKNLESQNLNVYQQNDTIEIPVYTQKENYISFQSKSDRIINDSISVNNEQSLAEFKTERFDTLQDYLQLLKSVDFAKDSSKRTLADIKNLLKNHREKIQKMDSLNSGGQKQLEIINLNEFEIVEKSEKKHRKLELGIELASLSNYSPDSKGSNFNVGGGISAGYRISKNISITTGMIIAKQSADFGDSRNADLFGLSRAEYADPNSLNLIDVSSSQSNISFVAIDIPLNLKYRHNQIIFSAGLSSLLFVNETYSYHYNGLVTNTTYNAQTLQYETNTTSKNFLNDIKSDPLTRFDFARLFNLAIGYDLPISRGSLVFEPYIKIPLGKISSQEIRMGSGGINLRYIF